MYPIVSDRAVGASRRSFITSSPKTCLCTGCSRSYLFWRLKIVSGEHFASSALWASLIPSPTGFSSRIRQTSPKSIIIGILHYTNTRATWSLIQFYSWTHVCEAQCPAELIMKIGSISAVVFFSTLLRTSWCASWTP
ncbi:hypothetical protein BDR03DRAFT_940346, partial [Suillus americanus]